MNQISLSSHDEIFLLLPWYVNQTLDAEEQTVVSSHIDGCAVCRQEIDFLTHVDSLAKDQDDVYAIPQNGFARMLHRIDQDDAARERSRSHSSAIKEKINDWSQRAWFGSRGLSFAISAALVLGVAGAFIWPTPSPHDPAYQTLTSNDASNDEPVQLKVTLIDDAEDVALEDYFQGVWNTIVGINKMRDGSYTIQLPLDSDPATMTQILQELRAGENIKSVELIIE